MKKMYLKSMMITKLCLWLLFISLPMLAMGQKQNSGGSAAPVTNQLRSGATPSTGTVKLNGGDAISWDEAMAQLLDSENTIELQEDVTFTTTPTKACIVTGADKTLTCSEDQLNLQAPITFKNIKLNILKILAQGNTLIFDEGVECTASFTADEIDRNGIQTIWAGGGDTDVSETNITIKSGSFGWIYGGSGNTGNVTGTATVTMSGGTVYATIFGGGWDGTCGNTEVTMTGGSTRWIYGGGNSGSVTNAAKLTISGTALITETIFGGGDTGSCGSTDVAINGGTIKQNVYAGGYHGVVTGLSSIVVDGARIDPDVLEGVYSGGDIYGGGYGENNVDDDRGKVGSTQVVIKGLAEGSHHNNIYGGGLYSKVTGNTDITIEGGDIQSVYASGYNYTSPGGVVGGNVNLLIKGGTIEIVSAARGQEWDAAASVTGTMNITMEGGTVKNYIRSGNELTGGVYKECTLTIKNLGSESNPYTLPGIYTITNLVLDNSVVKFKEPQPVQPIVQSLYGFTVMEDHPVKITGSGKLVGTNIFVHPLLPSSFSPNKPLVVAETLPITTTFAYYEEIEDNSFVTTPIYKAGKTYRMKKADETLYTVGIAAPETEGVGTASVKWDQFDSKDVMLEDGDQVPDKTVLTVSGVPASGYTLESITATPKDGQAVALSNNSTYTMLDDVTFAATFNQQTPPTPPETVYYPVTLPAVEGATTNPVAGIHQVESWSNFRFTLTLDKEYDQSVPVVTTSRGETITPNANDGAYVVTYVREPVAISISGIVKNTPPVGNATVEAEGTKVWRVGSTLYIQTLAKESVRITSFGGALLRQFITPGGDYQTQMPEGLYIIQVGESRFKVKM